MLYNKSECGQSLVVVAVVFGLAMVIFAYAVVGAEISDQVATIQHNLALIGF